ncbi:MAG: HAMP domain-containing protein [Actinobacteria bacterium]|nr:HAMP domain-containing protein [Actinomycetota bacterium]
MRVRTTLVATAVVGVALILGGVALVVALHNSMFDQLRTTASLRAEDVAKSIEGGRAPTNLADNDEEDVVVQVIDASGRVIGSSSNIAHQPRIATIEPGDAQTIAHAPIDSDAPFLVVAEKATVRGATYTVLVGRSTRMVDTSTAYLATILAAGIPVLLLLVGSTTWWIVGRALAPVEAMRREVDAISSTELHRRVPDPDSGDEIARLATTMNRMLDRLEESQRSQRRFVSDASHELRSPVAAIRQYAELAVAHPETTSLPELAGVVLDEDLRVQRLVEDLLFLARSDEGVAVRRQRDVDLDDLVFAESKRLREVDGLRVDTGAVSAARVHGDPDRLARLLRNLADNARRHARSTVRFTLAEHGGTARCTVEDDGDGIEEADRSRVFERFVRLDAARARDHGGSGLGLAIATEIVAAHHGTLTVESGDLGGARFVVDIPLSADSSAETIGDLNVD